MNNSKESNNKGLVRKYFDNVSEDYSKYKYGASKRSYMSVRQEKMLDYLDKLHVNEGVSLLDAGCGSGQFMAELTNRGYDAVGIDMSSEMLALTRNNIHEVNNRKHVNLAAADIESIPFQDNSFDIVSTAGVIEYLKDDDKVLKEFNRVLKNDGLLVISVTNKYSYNLLLDNIYDYFRAKKLFFKIMNFISKNILGHGELQPKQFNIRKHSPYAFRELLIENGYQIVFSKFFYFMPLPHPFNTLLFRLGGWLGSKLEILGESKLRILGEGYLLICKNIKN